MEKAVAGGMSKVRILDPNFQEDIDTLFRVSFPWSEDLDLTDLQVASERIEASPTHRWHKAYTSSKGGIIFKGHCNLAMVPILLDSVHVKELMCCRERPWRTYPRAPKICRVDLPVTDAVSLRRTMD